MPVNPVDSPVFGTLYGSDAMRAVFDEAAWFRGMLAVEAALARVQSTGNPDRVLDPLIERVTLVGQRCKRLPLA